MADKDKNESFQDASGFGKLDAEEIAHIKQRRENRKALVHVIDVRKVILDTCMYKDSYVDKNGNTVEAIKMSVDKFIALLNQCGSEDEYVFMKSGWQNGGAVKVVQR